MAIPVVVSLGKRLVPAGVAIEIGGEHAFVQSAASFRTWAHELGHMLGLNHGFDSFAANPLIPDDQATRLMSSGYAGGSGTALIKHERDTIYTSVSNSPP